VAKTREAGVKTVYFMIYKGLESEKRSYSALMDYFGFNTEKYLKVQKEAIEQRLDKFSGRLYLEFGGKLLWDYHASRTLPGYDANAKLTLLKSLERNLEIIYCISAKQLSNGKIRGDFGFDYGESTIQALEDLDSFGLLVSAVVINRFEGENEAVILENRLKRKGVPVYRRFEIEGYPNNLDCIFGSQGYDKDQYINVKKKLVVVWGAGPGSGKLSTCLGQVYHDVKRKINSGYAKFETFPVWNLPLEHPVNIAYEAATADLGDFNVIDPFHLKTYGKIAVNYNRDVEAFPIIKEIFAKILQENNFSRSYASPTDMGFNMLREGINNDAIVQGAAKREIVFYHFRYKEEYKKGLVDEETLNRMNAIMEKVGIEEEYLKPVTVARKARQQARKTKGKGEKGIYCGAAIQLADNRLVYGKNSPLLHAEASVVLNAVKYLAQISDRTDLISKSVIKEVNQLKKQMNEVSHSLNCTEALLALAVSGQTNPLAKKAQKYLGKLRGCFMHTTHLPSSADQSTFRKLGLWISTDGIVEKIRK